MHKLPLLLLSLLPMTACAFQDDGVANDSLESQLHQRAFLDIAPSSTVGVVATDAEGEVMPYVEPRVIGGRAVLRTTEDGWLLVEDLEVQLADVVIPPGAIGDDAITLTDVDLHLGTQLATEPYWSADGEGAWGTGDADLLLDWSMVTSQGNAYPLATQMLGDADFTIGVRRADDGTITAQVDTAIPGEVHRLSGLVTLSDLSVAVDAVEIAVE